MSFRKNFLFWLGLILLITFLFKALEEEKLGSASRLAFSDFLEKVQNGEIQEVTIEEKNIRGRYTTGTTFTSYNPDYPDLVDRLMENGVEINAKPLETSFFWSFLVIFGPILLLIGFWFFMMRQMSGGGGKAMGFGKSRARPLSEKIGKVTFEDVAGIDEAKDELSEIVDFLKTPHKFLELGGKIPKGCLLVGPPGTGKTLLARAIAGEANVPFFTISGSDFVEMFVGVGASRVRDMFEQGKRNAPCIIFIDEIDAVGRHRGAGLGGGNDEREQTLNQLLVEMDGFEMNEGVIIVAATNRPDVLDPALLRPGRFDRQIIVPVPDITGRENILKVHMQKVPLAPDVDPRVIARGTPGFSGADLANLVNEAALLAARNNKKKVVMQDFEEAKDKVLMGRERKSMVMSDDEKKLTAYHEAGHAIVGIHVEGSDPIHKATIIPRGRALGLVMRLPEADRVSVTREKLYADIAVAMGGRVAEEMIFGYDKVTSGASSDIKQATNIARHMVTEWGMSDAVGPLFHGDENEEVFLGASLGHTRIVSEETSKLIDAEVKRLVEEGYQRAQKVLNENNKDLHTLAKGLIEYETLSGDEITDLLKGKKLHRFDVKTKEAPEVKKSSISLGQASSKPAAKKKEDKQDKGKKTPKSSSKKSEKSDDKDQ